MRCVILANDARHVYGRSLSKTRHSLSEQKAEAVVSLLPELCCVSGAPSLLGSPCPVTWPKASSQDLLESSNKP